MLYLAALTRLDLLTSPQIRCIQVSHYAIVMGYFENGNTTHPAATRASSYNRNDIVIINILFSHVVN